MFFLTTAVRVLSLTGNHSPPYLPRVPSNMHVLVSGPAVGAVQILIQSYSCIFLPPMSTATGTSVFPLWELSMTFYIFQRHRVCPNWSWGFNLQLVQLVERFWVFFLSHTAPGFQLWFYFHLCMWVIHWVCSWGCSGGFESAPERARCGGGAVAWVTRLLAAPGTQGSWQLGQQEI